MTEPCPSTTEAVTLTYKQGLLYCWVNASLPTFASLGMTLFERKWLQRRPIV